MHISWLGESPNETQQRRFNSSIMKWNVQSCLCVVFHSRLNRSSELACIWHRPIEYSSLKCYEVNRQSTLACCILSLSLTCSNCDCRGPMRFHNVSRPDTIAPCHRQLSFEIRNHLGSNFHVINFHLNGVCSYESTTSKLHTAASLLTSASTRTFFSCFVSEALNCSPQHILYWVKENGELKA